MKIMKLNHKNQGFIYLGFLAILLVVVVFMFGEANRGIVQQTYGNTAKDKISPQDIETVKNRTESFFDTFKEGIPMNDSVYTDVTYQYFSKDFLENTFPTEKGNLFGLYGYERITHSYTNANGLQEEGGIKTFEIIDVETDNVHQTITTYVVMDALKPNTVHWIEWRNVPSEGWKINSMSFNGNIKALSPISPKKSL